MLAALGDDEFALLYVEALFRLGLPFMEAGLAEGVGFAAGLQAGLAVGLEVGDSRHLLSVNRV